MSDDSTAKLPPEVELRLQNRIAEKMQEFLLNIRSEIEQVAPDARQAEGYYVAAMEGVRIGLAMGITMKRLVRELEAGTPSKN
jgi:tetrahydromethanopterin S-methyltransferase subunit A